MILGISVTEWVGYLAMATLLISFTMKDIRKLRVVNSMGGFLFVIYGFMLQPTSWPIIVTNGAIIGINIYYLVQKRN